MIDFLKGKKTYIVAFVTAALAAADMLGYAEVTAPIYAALAALGLTASRVGSIKA